MFKTSLSDMVLSMLLINLILNFLKSLLFTEHYLNFLKGDTRPRTFLHVVTIGENPQ